MASRLGKHLLKAKATAENFGLFALYSSYFFYLLFGCPMANFWLLPSKQLHSSNVNHCIWAISFWPRAGRGWVFLKCGNAPNTGNRYSLTLWQSLGLQNTSLDVKCRVQNFSLLLINQWLKVPGSTVSLNWGNAPNTPKGE